MPPKKEKNVIFNPWLTKIKGEMGFILDEPPSVGPSKLEGESCYI